MNYKPLTDIEASFRRIEQRLDAMLEESRSYLESERIALRDESNRSGFDKGFPYFVWGYNFEKREVYRSELKVATANLRYIEPILEGEAQIIKVGSAAQIFQIGKLSRVQEVKETTYPIEEMLNMKLNQIVMHCIAIAEQVLAAY